jgi:hypothetical protein
MASAFSVSSSWDIVVSFLHPSGSRFGQLTDLQDQWVRVAADGLGAPKQGSADFWDWSHVRDSSDLAINRMAAVLGAMDSGLNFPLPSDLGARWPSV